MERGYYVELDPFALATPAFELFRYRKICQSILLPSGREANFFPVYIILRPHGLYVGVDSLEGSQVQDLFTLPLGGTPVEQRQLLQEIQSLFVSFSLNESFSLLPDYTHREEFPSFSHLDIWGSDFSTHSLDDPTNSSLNKAEILLDFLYDLFVNNLREYSPLVRQLKGQIEQLFPLNAIYYKAQFYYYLADQSSPYQSRLAKKLQYLQDRATKIIVNQWEYDAFLDLQTTWFTLPKERSFEIDCCKEKKVILPIEKSFVGRGQYRFMNSLLFLASDPTPDAQLRLGTEIRNTEQAIQGAPYRDHWYLVPKMAAQVEDLRMALLEHKPKILHFSGHGRRVLYVNNKGFLKRYGDKLFEAFQDSLRDSWKNRNFSHKKESETWEAYLAERTRGFELEEEKYQQDYKNGFGVLLFNHQANRSQFVFGQELVRILELYGGPLEGIILNCCHSHSLAEDLAAHIPFVVGIEGEIPDDHALFFSHQFYKLLGNGMDIHQAGEAAHDLLKEEFADSPYQVHIYPAKKTQEGQDSDPSEAQKAPAQ